MSYLCDRCENEFTLPILCSRCGNEIANPESERLFCDGTGNLHWCKGCLQGAVSRVVDVKLCPTKIR